MDQFIKKYKKNLMNAILMNCLYAISNRKLLRGCDENHHVPK